MFSTSIASKLFIHSKTSKSSFANCNKRNVSSFGVEQGNQHYHPSIPRIITDSPVDHAKGSWIFLENGRKLLDYSTGIAVCGTGHCHPKVVKAAQEQIGKIIHTQKFVAYSRPQLDLIQRLLPIMPSKNLDCFFFGTTGAEAVENAIKLAKAATGKTDIISVSGSFHGRSVGTLHITNSKQVYRAGALPLPSNSHVVTYPNCLHCKCSGSHSIKNCCNNVFTELELLIKQRANPDSIAAFIIEPILGEGGYLVPPDSFLPGVRDFCTKNNILLIADEIQSGFARTGKYFAIEHWNVQPDIMIMAKGIGSGFPISAIASSRALMEKQPVGSVGGTYAGNTVACAAAVATIDVYREENIIDNVNIQSAKLFKGLRDIQAKYPEHITDIRGKGLMIGVEFSGKFPGIAYKITKECEKRNLIIMSMSVYEALRFMPPLNTTSEEVDICLDIFSAVVRDVVNQK